MAEEREAPIEAPTVGARKEAGCVNKSSGLSVSTYRVADYMKEKRFKMRAACSERCLDR